MDFSTFWKTLVLLAIAGGAFFGYHYEQTQQAVKALNAELLSLRDARDNCKVPWVAYEPVQTAADQATAKTAALEKQKKNLEEKVQASSDELKKLVSSVRDTVAKVQTAAADEILPEVKLSDGKILKYAKPRKVEAAHVSFAHLDGIGSVPFDLLPADLAERLDVGSTSVGKAAAAMEIDLLLPPTHAAGLTLKCPVPLNEKDQRPPMAAITEIKAFEGKGADDFEVAVSCIRYAKGTPVDLEAAATGSLKAMSSLEGMSNVKQHARDVTVSKFPGKRTSMSARRYTGEVFAESLIIYDGEKIWVIIVGYSNKTKGGPQIVESILNSVQVDPKS